ncbi:hypothetical protein ARMGADRAFT_1091475 [Armillaria gallica]|uniref:Uncharacterized protein n=1 Tax=Armillaria gallica TaxID=47427 RepID=A0A2H3CPP4_ARMGA|nr:hypothetical protein ARMGADRAFT_1091475 [Armillaria gallica]
MSLVISTTIAAKNFLLMQKCLALYVKASIPKSDAFNLKSCRMNATGNATTAYPKCYDMALYKSLDLTITFTSLAFSVCQLVLIPLSCAKALQFSLEKAMIEVSRGKLTASDTLQTHIRACKNLEIMTSAAD